jgi:sulfur-oxidizing protein SoxB
MTGKRLKEVLEDAADNVFNPDPYYQQGSDMIRCGGIGHSIGPSSQCHLQDSVLVTPRSGLGFCG